MRLWSCVTASSCYGRRPKRTSRPSSQPAAIPRSRASFRLCRAPIAGTMPEAWVDAVSRSWQTTPERTFAILDEEHDEFLGVVTVRLVEEGHRRILARLSRPRPRCDDACRPRRGRLGARDARHPCPPPDDSPAQRRFPARRRAGRVPANRHHTRSPVAFATGRREAVLFELR